MEKCIDKEVEEMMSSGKYPIVGVDILEKVKDIEVFDITKDHIEYTVELYLNYLNSIRKLPEKHLNNFLRTLKAAEILDNQKLEEENSFLLSLYMTILDKNSIDEMIDLNGKELTEEKLLTIHRLLLEGTSSEKKEEFGYRVNDRKFVGAWRNGVRDIQYFPIKHTEISKAAKMFIDFYNSNEDISEREVLLKPFIVHGLLAALQLFNDGNTRLSRVLQHAKIWNLTKDVFNIELSSPAVYISRSYYPYRREYRQKIKNIVVNSDSVTWNDWFNFNLDRFEDQLFYIDSNLEEFQKIIL